MSHCQITLSVNAGVALHLGAMRVWSDALHDRRVVDDRAQGGRPTALIQQGVHRVDRAPDAKAEARMAGKRNLHADPPIAVAQSSCYNSMSYTKILLFSRKTLDLM